MEVFKSTQRYVFVEVAKYMAVNMDIPVIVVISRGSVFSNVSALTSLRHC